MLDLPVRTALYDLAALVRPHPLFPALGITCFLRDGAFHVGHHVGTTYPDTKKVAATSAHAALAYARETTRLQTAFARWAQAMAESHAYRHAAHTLGISISYDGTATFHIDNWRRIPLNKGATIDALVAAIAEGAKHASDGTVHGCFIDGLCDGQARLHPATIMALVRASGEDNAEVRTWMSEATPPKKRQTFRTDEAFHAQTEAQDLLNEVVTTVQGWRSQATQPISYVNILDAGDGPRLGLQRVDMDDRRFRTCSVKVWAETKPAPPEGWEAKVLDRWNALWAHLCWAAPILRHTSPTHPREGNFPISHSKSGTLHLWGARNVSIADLMLAHGVRPGGLHVAVRGLDGPTIPLWTDDTRKAARFAAAMLRPSHEESVHFYQ